MKQELLVNQKGFSSAIILISAAIIIGIIAITYGYFIINKSQPAQEQTQQIETTVPLTQQDPLQPVVGTSECPELDYTGCDNSGDFMTWTDDGIR